MAAGDDHGNATFPVVALVASKGGLAAVTAVLEPLPEDLRAGVIVLIHQEPDRVSELPQLLRSRCALPVSHAQHDEPLRAGHDGATGATVVHDFGGTVFASDEASSEEFSMPQATIGRDDAVDGVLPVAEMAARLCEVTGGA